MEMTAWTQGNQGQKSHSWLPVLDFFIGRRKSPDCHLLILQLD